MSPLQFKTIREKLGLNQEELNKVLGLSGKKAVSNIETGVRNSSKLGAAIMKSQYGSAIDRARGASPCSKRVLQFK